MGGGESFKGFPVPNPTESYWQLPPHDIANHRTTRDLPTSTVFDYVIVGSGVSGAAIAYKLFSRDPSTSILMLEARTAASAASGRNGGHCRPGWWSNIKKYAEAYGEDEALKFARLEEGNVQDIADFVKNHNVDCDFQDVETADLFSTESEWAKVLEIVRFREELKRRRPDAKYLRERKVWSGQEARDHLGIPVIVGAITYPGHAQNPYRLVCKMLELSLEMGLNLQTNTPAIEVVAKPATNGSSRWEVKTESGSVKAKQVILATNAYTNAIHRGLASTGFLTPVRNQVTALNPGGNINGIPALRGSGGISDFEDAGYFLRRAPGLQGEGDVIYGGGSSASKSKEVGTTDDSVVNQDIAKYLHHNPSHLFGRESWGTDGDVLRDWSGIICHTSDHFPLVGEAPGEKGLWMSVGMNGHGMAMAFRCAEALVESITTGSEPEWLPKMFSLERAWKGVPVRPHATGVAKEQRSARAHLTASEREASGISRGVFSSLVRA